MNMYSFWEDYVRIVVDIPFIILGNALLNAQLKQFSMDILAFNALKHKFGMEHTVLADVTLVKFGLMEIAYAQQIHNGMDTVVLFVMEVKFGILFPELVYAQLIQYGMDLHASFVMVEKFMILFQKPVFVLLELLGMDTLAHQPALKTNIGMQQLSNANVQLILFGMVQIVSNVQEEDFIIPTPVNVNAKMDFGMDIIVEQLVKTE